MNPQDPLSPDQQRQALRLKMHDQRQRMLELLEPQAKEFPRSMTMRVLTQKPDLALRLASNVAMFLMGPRLIRSLSTGLLMARLLHQAKNRKK
jgi:hypothetical protein